MIGRLAFVLMLLPLTGWNSGQVQQNPPLPGNAFVLRISTPAGRLFMTTIPEGERARIGRQNGRTLGLVATLMESGALEAVVTLKHVDPATGAETWAEVGRLTVQPHQMARFDDPLFPIGVEWTDTRTRFSQSNAVGSEPCTRCCVVCGGEVICACRVQSPCGDCCCSATCGCEIIG